MTVAPALATLFNSCTLHLSRSQPSLNRASLNGSQREKGRDRPPADKGMLTADGRPIRRRQGSGPTPELMGSGMHISADTRLSEIYHCW